MKRKETFSRGVGILVSLVLLVAVIVALLNMMIPLFWCAYFAAIHVPFAIQSRYTIPVRFLYLFVLAYLMYHVHSKKEQQPTAIQY